MPQTIHPTNTEAKFEDTLLIDESHSMTPLAETRELLSQARSDSSIEYNAPNTMEDLAAGPTLPGTVSGTSSKILDESGSTLKDTHLGDDGDGNVNDDVDDTRVADDNTIHEDGAIDSDALAHGTAVPANNSAETHRPQSFARSAQAINWGEDDDADSGWNDLRAGTDPFQSLGHIDRSNTFPAVPPNHGSLATDEQEIPHSQAEDIITQVENAQSELYGFDSTQDDFFLSKAAETPVKETLEGNVRGTVDHGHAFGGESEGSEYAERYEEGVPLVAPSQNDTFEAENTSQSSPNFFEENTESDDFFGTVGTASEEPPEQSLARKSTMQVLQAIHYNTDDVVAEDEGHTNALTGDILANDDNTDNIVETAIISTSAKNVPTFEHEIDTSGIQAPTEDLAAIWQAALAEDDFLDEDVIESKTTEDMSVLDPAAFFGSDDEGFLDDDELLPASPEIGFDSDRPVEPMAPSQESPRNPITQSRYVPTNVITNPPSAPDKNPYTPAGPNFTILIPQPSTDVNRPTTAPYASPPSIGPAPPHVPRMSLTKSSSFANQSKGGYQSPYDLPMDVVVPKAPRQRASMQHMAQSYNNVRAAPPVAPPRSTSMYSHTSQLAQNGSPAAGIPPNSTPVLATPHQAAAKQETAQPQLRSKASFFEELPVVNKPKPAGRYTPQPHAPTTPLGPAFNPMSPPLAHRSEIHQSQAPAVNAGLVAPPPVNPYATIGDSNPQQPPTEQNARYSPAPLQTPTPPPPGQGRYATAPLSRSQTTPYGTNGVPHPQFAHQPRTSSPLAQFEKSTERQPYNGAVSVGPPPATGFRRGFSATEQHQRALSITPEVDEHAAQQGATNIAQTMYQQARPPVTPPTQHSGMPSSAKRAASHYTPNGSQSLAFSPPKRSQTQSPGAAMGMTNTGPPPGDPYQRPVSVHGPASLRENAPAFTPLSPIVQTGRARGASLGINYVTPIDGREHDPLERWKGGPLFAWGLGGNAAFSFPKQVPRYSMGNSTPTISLVPGEVKLQSLKDIYPLGERLSSFPGPLKGKSKKKEVIAWLAAGIEALQQEASYLASLPSLSQEDKRKEEKLILYKTLMALIEHDGILEGNVNVAKAMRDILMPGAVNDSVGQFATVSDAHGIHASADAPARPEAVDPTAVEAVRKHLLHGEREAAVWKAVDQRLWAHAMLIANTVSKDLYKQVAQEFVQKEVRSIGDNTESIAALYEVFSGNFEESIDELVPPSARAGFQLVSASGMSGPAKDALDGLDRWRETLCLILSNRCPDDGQAIAALGKLLASYGRAEASHICFFFARTYASFNGIDDPTSNIVLVGADHLQQAGEFDTDLEAVLLSEVYEYGMSLSGNSNATIAPHLAIYKLRHASILAESGQREKALQYCDAIMGSVNAQTKRSPYHHVLLTSSLADLSQRLKQSPKDDSKSWISKPSMDKVSGTVWSRFNKFVAGDETEGQESNQGSEASDIGPFARIAGGTPTISRSPSNTDMYNSLPGAPSYSGAIPMQKPVISRNVSGSRYAPGAAYTPVAHPEQPSSTQFAPQQGVSAPWQSGTGPVLIPPNNVSQRYAPDLARHSSEAQQASSQYQSYPGTMDTHPVESAPYQTSNHEAERQPAEALDVYMHNQTINNNQAQAQGYVYAMEASQHNQIDQSQQFVGHASVDDDRPDDRGQSSDTYGSIEPANGYEPPETGYEPPAYVPYQPDPEEPDSPEDKPKKKSFMDDDDDDDIPALKALKKPAEKTKAEKDREADEAFRRAAEEDGEFARENSKPR